MWLLKEHVHTQQMYPVNKPSGHNFYLTHFKDFLHNNETNIFYREYLLDVTIQNNTVRDFLTERNPQLYLSFVKVFYDFLIQILFQVSIGL